MWREKNWQRLRSTTTTSKENNYKWIMIFIIFASSFSFSCLVHFLWSTNTIRLAVSDWCCCGVFFFAVAIFSVGMLQPAHKNDRYIFFPFPSKRRHEMNRKKNLYIYSELLLVFFPYSTHLFLIYDQSERERIEKKEEEKKNHPNLEPKLYHHRSM